MNKNQNQSNFQPTPASKMLGEAMVLEMRQTIQAIGSALVQYMGVSPARVILFQTLQATEEISQAEVQRQLGVGGAVVTRIFKRMEADGLITRRSDPADNRFTLVRLTEAGHKRKEEVVQKIHKVESTILDGLTSEDLISMQRSLGRIRQNAESLTGGSATSDQFPGGDYF